MRDFRYYSLSAFRFGMMLLLVTLTLPDTIDAQFRRDPRGVGMAGAYATVARDMFAVGVNPANLAIVRSYSTLQILNLDFSISNTSLTINEYNKFNGSNLELDNLKSELLDVIPDDGLKLFFNTNINTPLINFSLNNIAITTDIYGTGEISIPKTPFQIMLEGNKIDTTYTLDADGEAMVLGEVGFSNGGVFKDYLLGFTIRAIRGFRYYEIDSSSGFLRTDSTQIVGTGEYFMRTSTGGFGYALDVGLIAIDIKGWFIGASINNLIGHIRWGSDTKYVRYWYEVSGFNVNRMLTKGYDSLVDGGNEKIDIDAFTISYPRVFRMGASRRLPMMLFAIDFQKGFTDRFFASEKSRLAVGMEFRGIPILPLRGGIAVGGDNEKEFSVGVGLRTGVIAVDFASSFKGSFSPFDAKGIELAFGMYFYKSY